MDKPCDWWCVARGGQYTGKIQTEFVFHREQRCFEPTLHRRVRAKISCVLSCLVETTFEDLREQSRLKITSDFSRFIVKMSDVEKNSEAMELVKPK